MPCLPAHRLHRHPSRLRRRAAAGRGRPERRRGLDPTGGDRRTSGARGGQHRRRGRLLDVPAAKADLGAANGINSWAARGQAVYDELTTTASTSQAAVLSRSEHPQPRPHLVLAGQRHPRARRHPGDGGLGTGPGRRERHRRSADLQDPEPTPGTTARQTIDAVEWGIDHINADEVWSDVRRPGRRHRRRQHRHRRRSSTTRPWSTSTAATSAAAPSTTTTTGSTPRTSASPALALRQQRPRHPHDGHDGRRRRRRATRSASRRRRKWIAAKGCETNPARTRLCSPRAQWILAPDRPRRARTPGPTCGPTSSTTPGAAAADDPLVPGRRRCLGRRRHLPGRSPTATPARAAARPARPATTRRATAPAPTTSTTTSPASRAAVLGLRRRASSRTSPPRESTSAASCPANSLRGFSGTSMASPHVAGTVALMWSAAPAIIGDIDGDPGHPRQHRRRHRGPDLRRHRRRQQRLGRGPSSTPSPPSTTLRAGPPGTLTGTVTDAVNGNPIAGATVHATGRRRAR